MSDAAAKAFELFQGDVGTDEGTGEWFEVDTGTDQPVRRRHPRPSVHPRRPGAGEGHAVRDDDRGRVPDAFDAHPSRRRRKLRAGTRTATRASSWAPHGIAPAVLWLSSRSMVTRRTRLTVAGRVEGNAAQLVGAVRHRGRVPDRDPTVVRRRRVADQLVLHRTAGQTELDSGDTDVVGRGCIEHAARTVQRPVPSVVGTITAVAGFVRSMRNVVGALVTETAPKCETVVSEYVPSGNDDERARA